jgi:hypothetical protein
MPKNYFDAATAGLLAAFRARARMDRREELLADFSLAATERSLTNVWRPSAARIYRNWLAHLSAQKAARTTSAAFAGAARTSLASVWPGAAAASVQAAGDRIRRAPFIERRRTNDSSGLYSGARDRRISAQREPIPVE